MKDITEILITKGVSKSVIKQALESLECGTIIEFSSTGSINPNESGYSLSTLQRDNGETVVFSEIVTEEGYGDERTEIDREEMTETLDNFLENRHCWYFDYIPDSLKNNWLK